MSALTIRFDSICERLEAAAFRSGREPSQVQLVAVSKLHPATAVAELAEHWAASARPAVASEALALPSVPIFGESYLQEAREKMPAVAALLAARQPAPSVAWHFVGHIQSKKAKDIAGNFELLHSVDSLKLAQALQKAWNERAAFRPVGLRQTSASTQAVLVQVNIGQEAQKSGVAPEDLEELLNNIAGMPELHLQGLMCLPPLSSLGKGSRPWFIKLRALRDAMERRCGLRLPQLSMGMSDDFEAAIEEGATLIRIGTDIFGPRETAP